MYLYQNAEFLVYPSLYEGFGLPLLEAMSQGCPILASDIPSSVEVCSNAAMYFKNNNLFDLQRSMISFFASNKLRQHYSAEGYQRSLLFSPDNFIDNHLLLYNLTND